MNGVGDRYGLWAGLVLATAVSSGLSTTAFAQLAGGGLTDTGLGGSDGSLRNNVASLLAPPTVNLGRPWTFGGALDVEVGATDSSGGSNQGWQPFLLIAPDLNLSGTTSRLNVNVSYSPRLAIYPTTSGQSLLSNTLNADATVTIVPDWLYFNARAVTGLTSRFGGTSLASNSFYTKSDAVQTSSFSVSPYVQHQFGGWGTLNVAYIYSATFQDATGGIPAFAPGAASSAGFGTTGNLQTSTETASFATGENFGRIQDTVSVSSSQNTGSAFYNGSSTLFANNQISYALYRWLSLLASVGYEKYDYPQSGYHLGDVTWAVGFTVSPNADSSITLEYGRKTGIETILSNGTYSPTARTRIFGGYNVDVQTGLGAQQSLLASTTVGPGGLLVDRVTGTPVQANAYLASQFTLSRIKSLTVGAVLLLDRDTFSASVNRSQVTQLVNSTDVLGIATPAGTSSDAIFGTLGWQHDLSPANSLFSSVSYGTSSTGSYFGTPGSSQDTFQLYTGLRHTFTETLSGSVSYSHAERFGAAVRNLPAAYGGTASQNTVLVGLRKSF